MNTLILYYVGGIDNQIIKGIYKVNFVPKCLYLYAVMGGYGPVLKHYSLIVPLPRTEPYILHVGKKINKNNILIS